MKKISIGILTLVSAILFVCTPAAAFQRHEHEGKHSLDCNDGWSGGDRPSTCEIREQRITSTGSISVDGRKNGGISVKGWENADILVRARVQANGKTEAE